MKKLVCLLLAFIMLAGTCMAEGRTAQVITLEHLLSESAHIHDEEPDKSYHMGMVLKFLLNKFFISEDGTNGDGSYPISNNFAGCFEGTYYMCTPYYHSYNGETASWLAIEYSENGVTYISVGGTPTSSQIKEAVDPAGNFTWYDLQDQGVIDAIHSPGQFVLFF